MIDKRAFSDAVTDYAGNPDGHKTSITESTPSDVWFSSAAFVTEAFAKDNRSWLGNSLDEIIEHFKKLGGNATPTQEAVEEFCRIIVLNTPGITKAKGNEWKSYLTPLLGAYATTKKTRVIVGLVIGGIVVCGFLWWLWKKKKRNA